jgi:hypothetical protein
MVHIKNFIVDSSLWTSPVCKNEKYYTVTKPTRWNIYVSRPVPVTIYISNIIINAKFEIFIQAENTKTEVQCDSLTINRNIDTLNKFFSIIVTNISILEIKNCSFKSQSKNNEKFDNFICIENQSLEFPTEFYLQYSSISTSQHHYALKCLKLTKVAIISCNFVSSLVFSGISVVGISNSYFQNIFTANKNVIIMQDPEFNPIYAPRLALSYCYFGLANSEEPFIYVPSSIPISGTFITVVDIQNQTFPFLELPSTFIDTSIQK